MKTIKIKFVGFYKEFDYEKLHIYKEMIKHYNVVISDDPDYIICSCFADYDFCNYPQPRIMCSDENYIPDFNYIDYGITSYPLKLGDRHFSHTLFNPDILDGIDRNYGKDILEQKIYFANFIASHESEYSIRGDFFKKLDERKRVESAGTYLNNMENGLNVKRENKLEFQKKCKFTLCFESTSHFGFITEKIADAFYADTIPVYYGSPNITDIFNEKAFVNVSGRDGFDDAIEKLLYLDSHDDEYLKMLREPIFKDPDFSEKQKREFEKFVTNIFDQPIEQAYRRSRIFVAKRYEEAVLRCAGIFGKYADGTIYNELSRKKMLKTVLKPKRRNR